MDAGGQGPNRRIDRPGIVRGAIDVDVDVDVDVDAVRRDGARGAAPGALYGGPAATVLPPRWCDCSSSVIVPTTGIVVTIRTGTRQESTVRK